MKWISSTENNCFHEREASGSLNGSPISLGEKKQAVRGFGGCFNELGILALRKLSKDDQKLVFDELFLPENCNFTFNRMPMGANDFSEIWYSYDETDGDFELKDFSIERDRGLLIPYIKEAQSRQPDFQIFASPWSPPTWMKVPKVYNNGHLNPDPRYQEAYAEYICRFIEAYEAEGIHIDQYHIQNEPLSIQRFPSCHWTGEEFRRFIKDFLAPKFDEHKINSDIWLGTINGPENDYRSQSTRYYHYAGAVMEDPICQKVVKGISYQWAGKFAVQTTHDAYPELELIQSESECGDGSNSWQYAMYIFEMIRHYFRCGVSAYVYWNMALMGDGESSWGWRQNSLISVYDDRFVFNPEFYLMKHFSHFVKPGARLISTVGAQSPNCLAFENPNGENVLVIMNPYNECKDIVFKGESYSLEPRSFNTIVI